MNSVGKQIKALREELGMSQDDLAAKMGYKNRSTIAKIENGVNDVVQSNIVKFAEVLGTTPARLMGWEQEQANNNIIASIVIRLRSDNEFLSVVEMLNGLDAEKISGVKQMLSALLK